MCADNVFFSYYKQCVNTLHLMIYSNNKCLLKGVAISALLERSDSAMLLCKLKTFLMYCLSKLELPPVYIATR